MNRSILAAASAVLIMGSALTCVCAQGGAPAMSPDKMDGIYITPPPADEQLDYSNLYNTTFNRSDLDIAKARHYSDYQIASIYKIAKISGTTFHSVYDMVSDGQTFVTIAAKLGVDLRELNHVQKEEDEITMYQSAYAATGVKSLPVKTPVTGMVKVDY